MLVTVTLSVAALLLPGCGKESAGVEEPRGRPAVLNFWQPG